VGYKLVALDIDGTVRSNDYPVSQRTRDTVSRARDAGAIVTVATGRVYKSALEYVAELDIKSPIATFQGAHVADPATGEVLWHRPLERHMALAALDALESWGLDVLGYHGDEVYVSRLTSWIEAYGPRNQIEVREIGDLKRMAPNGLTRLVVVGDEDEICRLEQELKATFDSTLYVTRSLPHFCEILHPDGGKDKALAWMCEQMGIRQSETVSFGNGYNDVELVRWSGLGVAIGGAVPQVLEVADRVAPPLEQDGAAHVLQDLLDRGLIG
jgi:Cof subfamily protein (haloacid dehalogenase superfamily)